jgi:hypothetical protein
MLRPVNVLLCSSSFCFQTQLTKKCGKFKSEHFLPPRKKLTDSINKTFSKFIKVVPWSIFLFSKAVSGHSSWLVDLGSFPWGTFMTSKKSLRPLQHSFVLLSPVSNGFEIFSLVL